MTFEVEKGCSILDSLAIETYGMVLQINRSLFWCCAGRRKWPRLWLVIYYAGERQSITVATQLLITCRSTSAAPRGYAYLGELTLSGPCAETVPGGSG